MQRACCSCSTQVTHRHKHVPSEARDAAQTWHNYDHMFPHAIVEGMVAVLGVVAPQLLCLRDCRAGQVPPPRSCVCSVQSLACLNSHTNVLFMKWHVNDYLLFSCWALFPIAKYCSHARCECHSDAWPDVAQPRTQALSVGLLKATLIQYEHTIWYDVRPSPS